MTTIKENANPQLYFVENADRYSHTQRTPLDWTNLGSFKEERRGSGCGQGGPSCNNTGFGSGSIVVPTTTEDKAILRAIMDSSRSTTNGKGVNLLRKAGLVIPTYSSSSKRSAKTTPSSSWFGDSSRPVIHFVSDDKQEPSSTEDTSSGQGGKDNENNNNESESETYNDESDISAEEIFDIIRTIQDPEHPNSLEQLGVVSLEQVELSLARDGKGNNNRNHDEITVRFTPTIPHCSMATLIGLCLRVKLHRSLPPARFKVDVSIEPGTHVSEKAINKQLRDKERVRAALENKHLAGVVDKCIRNGMMMTRDQ
mmetsp:Transcript_369/g.934  ORF Transcript_369/g.934 Transcript_369/m.934 type:complete len:312 (+) Transcript_369:87-1022(+)